ncbi:DMT family transporter [Hansschlegelia sp.]|uniref:DMT family transporter n=1 Tax=Hansschlegelia sp. TaxID=2041892 RepID=UPI002BDF9C2F|nr:DMT family transporter [Hansschlegelia sp.]HVI27583.1 DMT family transporter [Hansschlegelia sp.]
MVGPLFFALLAVALGCAMALQGVVNAGLARSLGSSVFAATVSFWVGAVALAGVSLAAGGFGPALASARVLGPGWWIAGGLLGAFIVASTAFVVPRLGVGPAMAFAIAAQLITAVALDHFGLLGAEQHSLNAARAAGVVLLAAGALLIQFF